MAEERIDSIIDLPAVKKEFDQVMDMLEALGVSIKNSPSVGGSGPMSQGIAERKAGIKELQTQTEALISTEKKLETQIDATVAAAKDAVAANTQTAASVKAYNGTLDENIRLQIQYKTQLNDVRAKQKELEKSFTGTAGATKEYERRMHELVLQERELQVASTELNTIVKNQVKEMNAAGNSLNELRAQLNQMKSAADNMDLNSEEYAQAEKSIAALTTKIKGLEAVRGDFTRNVGNYAGSFSSAFNVLQKELDETRNKLEQLKAEGGSEGAIAQLTKETELLETLTQGLNKTFTSTKTEMRALQETAKKMGIELGSTNETFQRFAQEVGAAKDEVGDLDNIIKQNASDTKTFDGLIAAAQGLAGAYGVAQGAAELFGSDNEELQKKMVKFQAILTVLQGLQAVQNALQKEGAAIQTLLAVRTAVTTAAQKAYTFVTAQATAATTALKAAIMSTGIGALLVLLGLLISKMASAADSTKGAAGSMRDFDAAIDDVKDNLAGDLMILDLNMKKNAERIKQRGGSEKELSGLVAKNLQEQQAAYAKNVERITKLEDDLQRERKRLIRAGASDNKEALEKLDEAEGKLRQERIASNNAMVKSGFDYEVEIEKARTKAAEDARKSAKGFSEAKIIDLEKEAAAYSAVAGDETKSYQERIAALNSFYEKQQQITKAKAGVDLSQPGLTGGERAKINAAKNKELADQERQFNQTLAKLTEQGLFRQYEIQAEYAKLEQELIKRKNQDILSDEDATNQISLEQRLAAAKNLLDAQTKILTAEYELKKKRAGTNNAELLLLEKQHENALILLTLDSNAQIAGIIKAAAEKRKQISLESAETMLAALENKQTQAYAKEVMALNSALTNKEITLAEYNKRREKLDDDFATQQIKNQIAHTKKLLSYEKDGSKEKEALLKKVAELELSLDDKTTQKKLGNQQKLRDAQKALANELINLTASLVQGGYDRQKNALEDQIVVIENNKKAEIDRITSSTLSEQEKADKIKIIEAKAQADKEALERRKRQIDMQKAKFDRDRSIFEIGVNTAVAISKAVAEFPLTGGMPFAAIAAAIGAVQIAAVLAKPLPKFEKGTTSSPEGYAITDEKGPEKYIEPDGKTYMGSDKGPTLRYLKRGTKIIPADEAKRAMVGSVIRGTTAVGAPKGDSTAAEVRGLKEVMYWQTGEMTKAFKKQRPNNVRVVVTSDWNTYIQQAVRE